MVLPLTNEIQIAMIKQSEGRGYLREKRPSFPLENSEYGRYQYEVYEDAGNRE